MRRFFSSGSRITSRMVEPPGSVHARDASRACPPFYRFSAEQFGADLAAIDDLDGAIAGGHQFLVGDDAELVVDGRGQVLRADRVVLGLAGRRVRGAVDVPLLDAAAGQDDAE